MMSHALYTVFAMRSVFVCVCVHDVDDVRVDSFDAVVVTHSTSVLLH